MKKRLYKEKVVLFMLSVILVMGMAACSFEAKVGTAVPEAVVEPKTTEEETPETEKSETEIMKTEVEKTETKTTKSKTDVKKAETETKATEEENGKEDSTLEAIIEGDPIVGFVDKYSDNIIVIRDADDQDLIYYFSTKNAQVVEGDLPIAAGDIVAITYRGVMGDEEHPGEAVKVERQ